MVESRLLASVELAFGLLDTGEQLIVPNLRGAEFLNKLIGLALLLLPRLVALVVDPAVVDRLAIVRLALLLRPSRQRLVVVDR
jgi:hypothetical protein